MAEPQDILINFKVDDKQLVDSITKVKNLGLASQAAVDNYKKSVAGITGSNVTIATSTSQAAQAVTDLSTAVLKTVPGFDKLDEATRSMVTSIVSGFTEGMSQELAAYRLEMEKLGQAQDVTGEKSVTLITQQRNLKNALAELAAAGQQGGEKWVEYSAKLAKVGEALQAAGRTQKAVTQDFAQLETVTQTVSGVTGAFSAMSGAVALFGGETNALSETMVRLNQVQAISMGLMATAQSLRSANLLLTKYETSALIRNTAAIELEYMAKGRSTAATWLAVTAQKAFNLVLSVNPILLIVTALAALGTAFEFLRLRIDAAKKSYDAFVGGQIDQSKVAYDDDVKRLERAGEIRKAQLTFEGKKQSEISQFEQDALETKRKRTQEFLNEQLTKEKEIQEVIRTERKGKVDESLTKSLELIRTNKAAAETTLADISKEISVKNYELITQRTAEIKDQTTKAAAAGVDAEKDRVEKVKRLYDDQIAYLKTKQLSYKENTRDFLDVQAEIIRKEAEQRIATEKLTVNEVKLVNRLAAKEISTLYTEFSNEQKQKALDNAAEIAQANAEADTGNIEQQFSLKIAALDAAFEAEKNMYETQGKSITAIVRKYQREQLDAENNYWSQKRALQDRAAKAEDVLVIDALTRVKNETKNTVETRKAALLEIQRIQLENIKRQEQTVKGEVIRNIKTPEQGNAELKDLQNERVLIWRNTEEEITAIVLTEEEKRKAKRQKAIEDAGDFALQTLSIVSDFISQQADRDIQAAVYKRKSLEELNETGQVTEREYKRRVKVIDAEERKVQVEAAKRSKVVAMFEIAIQTAIAVSKALAVLPAPNFVLAAITAAFGAAQLAVVAAKPLPKFERGTQHAPEGLAVVGEKGSELVVHESKMYITPPKPTIVWLKSGSKVLTAERTREVLQSTPRVENNIFTASPTGKAVQVIDESKIAKAIAAELKQVNVSIDKDGFRIWQQAGDEWTEYLNDRYKL